MMSALQKYLRSEYSHFVQGGVSFFFDRLKKFKEYSRLCLGKWASPAYDTVDPRKAGHMTKTQSSHAYTRGLSDAVGKTATPYGKPIMCKI